MPGSPFLSQIVKNLPPATFFFEPVRKALYKKSLSVPAIGGTYGSSLLILERIGTGPAGTPPTLLSNFFNL